MVIGCFALLILISLRMLRIVFNFDSFSRDSPGIAIVLQKLDIFVMIEAPITKQFAARALKIRFVDTNNFDFSIRIC